MQTSEKYELSALKLWSPLQRYLAINGQPRATPQQWIGTIRNLQKKGVSSVEIEWSKIIPTLEEHRAPLLRIDEVIDNLTARPYCELVLQRNITDDYEPLTRWEKQQRPAEVFANWFPYGRREARVLHYRDRSFGLCIWLHEEIDPDLFGGRRTYWSLSVPGGRKGLVPRKLVRNFGTLHEAKAHGQALVTRMARRLANEGFVGRPKSANRYAKYVLPGGKNYIEWLITAPNLPAQYWGPHFDLPNIVAHLRTTERTTPEGDRLLVLEEIQSDWNDALREANNDARRHHPADAENIELIAWDDDTDRPPNNPYRKHWLAAALRMMLLLAANQGVAGIAWLPGKVHAERYPWANADAFNTLYDHIVPEAVKKLAKSWGLQLSAARFPTVSLSRRFAVRRVTGVTGARRWRVLKLDSSQFVGSEFANHHQAEAFRRTKENPVLESVSALFIPDEMRADILKHGLPYLGAVGKRPAHRQTQ